ncbi:PREDICTED: uncharacterized protein LOC105598624 [Cercocebus atys]|uniref:uncharacterized protein LOC105598624 n=1 Tax=Cercocebus atys TaxID=9531 RepID=UPI0005F3AA89|nr:PREDICTED: uncharacterized protein LOC105598624 [Cercocebus atys]
MCVLILYALTYLAFGPGSEKDFPQATPLQRVRAGASGPYICSSVAGLADVSNGQSLKILGKTCEIDWMRERLLQAEHPLARYLQPGQVAGVSGQPAAADPAGAPPAWEGGGAAPGEPRSHAHPGGPGWGVASRDRRDATPCSEPGTPSGGQAAERHRRVDTWHRWSAPEEHAKKRRRGLGYCEMGAGPLVLEGCTVFPCCLGTFRVGHLPQSPRGQPQARRNDGSVWVELHCRPPEPLSHRCPNCLKWKSKGSGSTSYRTADLVCATRLVLLHSRTVQAMVLSSSCWRPQDTGVLAPLPSLSPDEGVAGDGNGFLHPLFSSLSKEGRAQRVGSPRQVEHQEVCSRRKLRLWGKWAAIRLNRVQCGPAAGMSSEETLEQGRSLAGRPPTLRARYAPRSDTHQAHAGSPVHAPCSGHQLPPGCRGSRPSLSPLAWTPLQLCFRPQMAPLREAQPVGSPSSSPRPGRCGREAASPLLRPERAGRHQRRGRSQTPILLSQTPSHGARTREECGREQLCVSPSQTGDTPRTSAYLCVGGPAWSPLSESRPAGSSGCPWIKPGPLTQSLCEGEKNAPPDRNSKRRASDCRRRRGGGARSRGTPRAVEGEPAGQSGLRGLARTPE